MGVCAVITTADFIHLRCWFEANFVLVLALVLPDEDPVDVLALKGDRRLQKECTGAVEVDGAIVVDLDRDIDRHDWSMNVGSQQKWHSPRKDYFQKGPGRGIFVLDGGMPWVWDGYIGDSE